jgi:uncharacterized protein (TIGR01777 family)
MAQATTAATAKRTKRILITGASGLVGSALGETLRAAGHQVVPMKRSKPADLEEADVIVHLAGENIAAPRWTKKKKQVIRDSRVQGTTLLSETIARLDRKPSALICASAIGIYGSRGDETLDEASSPGSGFLADVSKQWEAACEPAREAGVRVVNTRFGMVLSGKGGALRAMLTPFRLGIGGVVGSGKQWWSWVHLDDVVRAITFAMDHDEIVGPINVVSPNPATNREFTKMLGHVLSRPTILPLPAFAARLAMAEMADELLLASVRVQPRRLLDAGFEFVHPRLEEALRSALAQR